MVKKNLHCYCLVWYHFRIVHWVLSLHLKGLKCLGFVWFFGQLVKNIRICGRLSFHCCCISTNKRTYLIFYFFFFKCQTNIEESLVIIPPMNNMSDYRKSGWRKCFPPTTFIIIDLEALLCRKHWIIVQIHVSLIFNVIIKSSISM